MQLTSHSARHYRSESFDFVHGIPFLITEI